VLHKVLQMPARVLAGKRFKTSHKDLSSLPDDSGCSRYTQTNTLRTYLLYIKNMRSSNFRDLFIQPLW
jgi:hypothetical protein